MSNEDGGAPSETKGGAPSEHGSDVKDVVQQHSKATARRRSELGDRHPLNMGNDGNFVNEEQARVRQVVATAISKQTR